MKKSVLILAFTTIVAGAFASNVPEGTKKESAKSEKSCCHKGGKDCAKSEKSETNKSTESKPADKK